VVAHDGAAELVANVRIVVELASADGSDRPSADAL
jgi:hypothetical protein